LSTARTGKRGTKRGSANGIHDETPVNADGCRAWQSNRAQQEAVEVHEVFAQHFVGARGMNAHFIQENSGFLQASDDAPCAVSLPCEVKSVQGDAHE
jgi:hypothetical protein